MRYKLAIFDFDGTLADSASWMFGVFNGLAERHHFRRASHEEIEMLRGVGNRQIMAYLGVQAWRLPFIARDVRKLSADAAAEIPLFPGVAGMIEQLSAAGIQIGIVSSNGEATIRRVLGDRLAGLVAHYECGAGLFGKARKLKKLAKGAGVAAEQVVCIGDETRDIEAAREAGFAAVAVTWGYAKIDVLEEFRPDMMVDTVDDLAAELLAKSTLENQNTR